MKAAAALCALLALAGLSPAAQAQAAYTVIESGTVPLRAYVGDPVELRVRVRLVAGPGAAAAELRAPKKLPSEPWLDLHQVRVTPVGGGDWDVWVRLVAFAPGPSRLPDLDLGGAVLRDLRVQTASILDEKKMDRPAPPRDQLVLPGTALRLAVAAALLLGLPALAIVLAARGLRTWKRLNARMLRARPWSRLQRALRRLRGRSDRLGGREFYIELTAALRVYLERRHGLRATTATSGELRGLLRALASGEREAVDGLTRLFERGDLVKFGGFVADGAELLAAADGAEACSARLEEAARGDA